ncbi:unnamed protein product, partial [Larinioides sclopetarius]
YFYFSQEPSPFQNKRDTIPSVFPDTSKTNNKSHNTRAILGRTSQDHGQMMRMTPEPAPSSPNFRTTPTGGHLATTYDLTCKRPHTRRIFSGIRSRT